MLHRDLGPLFRAVEQPFNAQIDLEQGRNKLGKKCLQLLCVLAMRHPLKTRSLWAI